MSRPCSERRIHPGLEPRAFKPAGIPARDLVQVTLSLDQAEAIRLADLEGLYQEAAAMRMGVSRQTFGRILESGRRLVADAIINGKCLRFGGGPVIVDSEGEKQMKVAVPARDGQVDAHFGHCEHFMVYSLDQEKSITAEEKVESPAGCGCKSGIGSTLARMGVSVMVAGNMGQGAVNVLAANGIAVIRGASGSARAAVEQFAAGTLADSGAPCASHEHGHGHDAGGDCHHG
jgi:predicted DNA-binding protein (UPF0251 family)/predicted Fe-Mo cluster-binding NifX family protein